MCEGHTLGDDQSVQTDIEKDWLTQLGGFLEHHTGHQQLSHSFDIAFIIECTKHQYAYKYFADDEHSTLLLYRTLHPEYKYADYLSAVKCWSNRRLIDKFRSGCHGLRVDTGRWAGGVHIDRKDRLCLVCKSLQELEDKQHFLFECPAYSHIRAKHAGLFQHMFKVPDFFARI